MKYQILFSGKNYKIIINLSSAEKAQRVLTLGMLGNFACFFVACGFFFFFCKLTFSKKKSFRNTIRVSNSLNPDQARQNGLTFCQA